MFRYSFENGKRPKETRPVAAFAIAAAVLVQEEKEKCKKRRERGEWTKKWLLRRDEKGIFNNLVSELRLEEQNNTPKLSPNDIRKL